MAVNPSNRSRAMTEALEPRRMMSFGPLGDEFQVNSIAGGAGDGDGAPDVAMDAAGNFVVTWTTRSEGSGFGIAARLFDSSGDPRGPQFLVNQFTSGNQTSPSIAVDGDGQFVIAWLDGGRAAQGGLFARRFDDLGAPLGDEFAVNTTGAGGAANADVATNASGDLVFTWSIPGTVGPGVYFRRYDPSGAALGAASYLGLVGALPNAAMDDAGNFVLAWTRQHELPISDSDSLSERDVFAQRFDASGNPRGARFQVNRARGQQEQFTDIAGSGDGSFVVTWDNNNDVYARAYDAAGVPTTPREFRVNTFRASSQIMPSSAMDAQGNFVIAYESEMPGASDAVFQRFSADTVADGLELNAGQDSAGGQESVSVAVSPAGSAMVVVWDNNNGGFQGEGIRARRFAGTTDPGVPIAPDLIDASDSGVSISDGVTNDTTPTFIATAASGSTVRLLDDGVEVASAIADIDGEYIVTPAIPLPQGERRFRAAITAPQGGAAVLSRPTHVIIDTFGPTLSNPWFSFQRAPHFVQFLSFGDLGGTLSAGDLTLRDPISGNAFRVAADVDAATGTVARLTFPDAPGGVVPDSNYRLELPAGSITDVAGNPLLNDFRFDFFFLMADALPDRKVDLGDFNALALHFGTTSGATFAKGDFNYDGRVNLDDFNILAQRFGSTLSTPTAGVSLFDATDESVADATDDLFPR